MRVALPVGLFSSGFTIHDHADGPALAEIDMPGLIKPGQIWVGDVPYTFKATDWMGRRTVLEFEGVEVGEVTRPSLWTSDLVVAFAPGFGGDLGPFRLARQSLFTTGYRVEHEEHGGHVGDIVRPSSFGREMSIDLPESVPFLAQAFLTTAVLLAIQRAQGGG